LKEVKYLQLDDNRLRSFDKTSLVFMLSFIMRQLKKAALLHHINWSRSYITFSHKFAHSFQEDIPFQSTEK
jgi:hypothetical protein